MILRDDAELVLAADGLVARSVRPWAKEKLFYIGRYMDIFSNGMKRQRSRLVYIDLFAGPGRSVVKGTGEEIPGSPMLSLNPTYPFTQRYFNDADPRAAQALRARIESMETPATGVEVQNLDCNDAARDAAMRLLPQRGDRPLALAVIDPTAFQISFDALADMTRGNQIDLIITLMTGYVRRFINHPDLEAPLDSFFGSHTWRDLRAVRAAGGRISFRDILDYFEGRIAKLGYGYINDLQNVHNTRGSTIYHIVFASKHARGADFFTKISQRRSGGQRRLL